MREKTSIKVMLDWIASGKNYWRWKTHPDSRAKYCADIKAQLSDQGIQHRSTMDICKKIKQPEISVVYAKSLLDEEGLSGSTTFDACNLRLKSKIMRCCVHFRVLASVMMNYMRMHGENNRPIKRQRSNESVDDEKVPKGIKTPVKPRLDQKPNSPAISVHGEPEEKHNIVSPTSPTQVEPTEKQPEITLGSPELEVADESRVKETQRNTWHSDQVKGKTSIEVLLDWITEGRNYDRWKCGQFSTERLCHEINSFLQRQGIRDRTNTDIMNKIERLEESIGRAAANLAANGKYYVLSLGGEFDASLKASVLEICPFIEILAPYMIAFATHQRKDNESVNVSPNPATTQAVELWRQRLQRLFLWKGKQKVSKQLSSSQVLRTQSWLRKFHLLSLLSGQSRVVNAHGRHLMDQRPRAGQVVAASGRGLAGLGQQRLLLGQPVSLAHRDGGRDHVPAARAGHPPSNQVHHRPEDGQGASKRQAGQRVPAQ